jgi:hypothetical protein
VIMDAAASVVRRGKGTGKEPNSQVTDTPVR